MKLAASSLLALGIFSLPALAADTYSLDTEHTIPSFEIRHLGLSTQRGRFTKVSGRIELDRAQRKGKVSIAIDANSIDMGLEKWDQHMKSEDFFNVAKHPRMVFESDSLRFEGDKPVAAEGRLTLLGVTQAVTLQIERFHCGTHPFNRKEACGADATARIKRSDFGMKYGLPAVADEVVLRIPVEAFKD